MLMTFSQQFDVLFFTLMQLHVYELLCLYILIFRKENIDFFGQQCAPKTNLMLAW